MKTRFTQKQEIFQVEIHNGRAIEIHKKEVISCGVKILKLKGTWTNEDCRLDNGFSKIGTISNFIEQFHATEEEAIKEMDLYNSKI